MHTPMKLSFLLLEPANSKNLMLTFHCESLPAAGGMRQLQSASRLLRRVAQTTLTRANCWMRILLARDGCCSLRNCLLERKLIDKV